MPPVLVFVQHAIGDRVEGNWPAILFPAAAVAAAGLPGPVWRRWTGPSCVLGFGIAAVVYGHVMTGWPSLRGGRDPVATQLFGWPDLAARVETARETAHADFVATEPYGVAAELAWSLPPDVAVLGTGSHWAFTTLPRLETGDQYGLLIRPERYGDAVDSSEWRQVTRLPDIARTGASGEIERYAVFRVRRADATTSEMLLPHR
jgi:hypothetical protein